MVERKYGRIVNLISGLAERGMINASAFAASQAGILSLTRSLAVEWGRHNIRVNALGTSWSTAEDIPLEKQREELLVRYTPLRRKGHPRDIGPLLVYLCSEACDYTTGQAVYVDGDSTPIRSLPSLTVSADSCSFTARVQVEPPKALLYNSLQPSIDDEYIF